MLFRLNVLDLIFDSSLQPLFRTVFRILNEISDLIRFDGLKHAFGVPGNNDAKRQCQVFDGENLSLGVQHLKMKREAFDRSAAAVFNLAEHLADNRIPLKILVPMGVNRQGRDQRSPIFNGLGRSGRPRR